MRVLVDEDLPRSLAEALQSVGIEAHHVLDLGLRGASDDRIYARAIADDWVLLTADLGFGNTVRFPLMDRPGIIIARFPNEIATSTLNTTIAGALRELEDAEVRGALVLIEPGRVRIRRPR
jgi:predicted nuclease of predicted toxin-antitoxin system